MDGVLIDSEKLWVPAEIKFTQKLIPNFPAAEQKKFCGMSLPDSFKFLQKNFGLKISAEKFFAEKNKFAIDEIYKKTKLMPGVKNFLKKISAAKIPAAIASSSPHEWISTAIDRLKIREFFAEIISADDVAGRGKPAPDIFLLAAKKLKIAPQNCLIFEDSEHGISAARAAKIPVFAFKNGFNNSQNLSAADEIFSDFSKISEKIFEKFDVKI